MTRFNALVSILSCLSFANGFVVTPTPQTAILAERASTKSLDVFSSMDMQIGNNLSPSMSQDFSSIIVADAGSTALTVLGVLGVLAIAYFLISSAMVNSMVDDIKKSYPDFYQSYVDRLEPGQDLKQRPDLLQEMIQKVADKVTVKFQEVDELAKRVEARNPEEYEKIASQLRLGETFAMREDLFNQLVALERSYAPGVAEPSNQWADESKDEIR